MEAAEAGGVTGPHDLPPFNSHEWRVRIARQHIMSGYKVALNYLELVGDPRPMHTAAQAIWREAIDRTAEAVKPANDTREYIPLLGDEGD